LIAPKDTRSGDVAVAGSIVGVAEYDAKQGGDEVETKPRGLEA
jgi:predicted RecA/RadA family phage recombinase